MKRTKLEPSSEAAVEGYIETNDNEERALLQYIETLHTQDLLTKLLHDRVATWKATAEVTRHIRMFSRALLLMPNLQYYSGSLESAVITALRSASVPDLPPDGSLDDETLRGIVARHLTLARNQIKTTVKDTMKKGTNAKDRTMDVLVANIVSQSQLKCINTTLALYWRVAFIRMHVAKKHNEKRFWAELDAELEVLHNAGPRDFVLALEMNMAEDAKKYGSYVKPDIHLAQSALSTDSPTWFRKLHELAARVQRIDKSRKRSRRDAFENDGDEEPGTNEDASGQDEMLGGTSAPPTSEPDITFDTEDDQ
ncbi:hypothetical protein GGX14DRAFT_575491 [Mycena pura]|nr:hypothetical protein GGX14DRAFT_575491 [Mycena pura]